MKIVIETIPHTQQKYETVGNWQFDEEGDLKITVSNMKNWKYNFLVAFHELAEVMLCKDRNISEKSVTNFDKRFEQKREDGNIDEPGDDPKAPYRKEHFFATTIERLMAAELNVNWKEYDKTVVNL